MKFLDLTLATPAENLAWEEAYLDKCDSGRGEELLRFYESPTPFVVLGYGNKVAAEVDIEYAHSAGVGMFRRISGGGTVLQGPGCLSYALFLEIAKHTELGSITSTNNFIMEKNRAAISRLLECKVEIQGHTDLALNGLKFSGNAQRRKRNIVLFHGTFLLNFDLDSISRVLKMPSSQPDYRMNRPHSNFLANLKLKSADVKSAFNDEWNASVAGSNPQPKLAKELVEKYNSDAWNQRI